MMSPEARRQTNRFYARAMAVAQRTDPSVQEHKEAALAELKERLAAEARLREEIEQERAHEAKRQAMLDRRDKKRELAAARGVELVKVRVDLGGQATREWIEREILPEVPELSLAMAAAQDLTTGALRHGLEKLKKARRAGRKIDKPGAWVVRVAAEHQDKNPTLEISRYEAEKRPELIIGD